MDRDQILALAERCEQATGPNRDLSSEIYIALYCRPKPEGYRWPAIDATVGPAYPWLHPDGTPTNLSMRPGPDYTGSLDAALKLLDLWDEHPEWQVTRRYCTGYHASVGTAADTVGCCTPALAICAAALRDGMISPSVCRSCGSTKTRAELDAGGWVNCCPERSMNELIEERHAMPALVTAENYAKQDASHD